VAEPVHVKRLQRALASLGSVADPLARLTEVRTALIALEALEASSVSDARATGATWSEIGAVYGLSKQGAQQRFRTSAPAP
jgi:hypothetical protein